MSPLRIGFIIWIMSLRKAWKKNSKKNATAKTKWMVPWSDFFKTIDINLAKKKVNKIVAKKIIKIDLRTTKSNSWALVFINDKKGIDITAIWTKKLL